MASDFAQQSQTETIYHGPIDGMDEWARQMVWSLQGEMGVWDHIMAFIHAVNWTETWLLSLLLMEMLLLGIAIKTQQNWKIQCTLYIIMYIIVYCSQYINEWCSNHWQSFSSQNYFDPSGMFITFVVSIPLSMISLIAVVLGLYNTAQLVIQVKTFEFKQSLKARAKLESASRSQEKNKSNGIAGAAKKAKAKKTKTQ